MWRKYALFSLLLMSVKLVLLITFFCAFFYNFFNGFEISTRFWVFWYLFWFCLGHISTFWKLWSQTRKKRLKKSIKVFSKCVLDFNFAPIKGSVFFIKKSQILCTLVQDTVVYTLGTVSQHFLHILWKNSCSLSQNTLLVHLYLPVDIDERCPLSFEVGRPGDALWLKPVPDYWAEKWGGEGAGQCRQNMDLAAVRGGGGLTREE